MLLTRTSSSDPDPLTLVGTSADPEDVAPVRASGTAVDDSCPWRRTENEPPDPRSPRSGEPRDIVEEWGLESFPASDPPANW